MITLKSTNYRKNDWLMLKAVLRTGIMTVKHCNGQCKGCPQTHACSDLSRFYEFVSRAVEKEVD